MHPRVFTYIYGYFSKKKNSFPSYVVRISLCNILYYISHSFELLLFFLFPFSHLHFFTCHHISELFVIWKFIVAIFFFVTISYFLLLSTLYISITLYTFFFVPLLYEMLLHSTFLKKLANFYYCPHFLS
jgi:hypothetical protein